MGGVDLALVEGMDKHERKKKRRIRRILESRRGRGFAVAGLVGATGVGALRTHHEPVQPPTYRDPVKETVAKTMVERLAGRGWDLPNLEHERVDFWTHRFATDPEMKEKMTGFLSRSGVYMPMIAIKLEERDMPHDLIFLAMIESGFDPEAYSGADASGLWQFIAETGRRYGLAVNDELDERNHPEKATDAALDYLSELHERFDSWYLAAAAYNTGENRVARIMREETGSERAGSEEAYYEIWDRLPKETRDYVPLMIAAARIAKEPEKYGFEHVVPLEPLQYDEFAAAGGTSLTEIADAAGVGVEEIQALNPFLTGDRTPSRDGYAIRVPRGAGRQVASALPITGAATSLAE
jgi:membrane-bound lytic murein transglycosylase D